MNSTVDPKRAARDQFYREVGTNIRVLRKKKGLKQENVAQSLGLTRTSLSNIEKGRQGLMLHTFVDLAAALGEQPQALLPTGTAMLEKLGDKLPASMDLAARDFVARAMSPSILNEYKP